MKISFFVLMLTIKLHDRNEVADYIDSNVISNYSCLTREIYIIFDH